MGNDSRFYNENGSTLKLLGVGTFIAAGWLGVQMNDVSNERQSSHKQESRNSVCPQNDYRSNVVLSCDRNR